MRFRARSMKTNSLFSRYPRKISLLKDLRERDILEFLQPRKSVKTGIKFEMPSKIAILNDLASMSRAAHFLESRISGTQRLKALLILRQ
jgi:hypothetical protein